MWGIAVVLNKYAKFRKKWSSSPLLASEIRLRSQVPVVSSILWRKGAWKSQNFVYALQCKDNSNLSRSKFNRFFWFPFRSYTIVACTILCPTTMKSTPGYSMSKPQSTKRSNSQRQTSQTQTYRKKVAIKKHMVHGIETAVIVHANIKTFFQRVDFRDNFNNRGNFALGLSAGSKYLIGDNQMRV